MILVDFEIMECIEEGSLIVDPFKHELINPASLDFRLGKVFSKVKPSLFSRKTSGIRNCSGAYTTDLIDPTNPKTFKTSIIDVIKKSFSFDFDSKAIKENSNKFWIGSGEFIIATSLETFNFKGGEAFGLAAKVMGKSSLGRLGLCNSSMAGWIDPGFSAPITLELHNYNKYPILLTEGMKIGQLVLYRTRKPYSDYSKTGRYQNQKEGFGSLGI